MRSSLVMSVLWLLAVATLGGCNRPSYDTPVSAYQTFLRAMQRGDEKTAFEALSEPTREALKARAQTAASASSGTVKADPAAFFFANAVAPTDVTEVNLAGETDGTAQVNVVFSSEKKQVRMVREMSGWKIDLTQSLQQP